MRVPRGFCRGLPGLMMLLAACSAWTPIPGPIPAGIEGRQAETLRARNSSGRVLTGIGATVRDSLLVLEGPGGVRDSMPVAEVVRMERYAYSPRRTWAIVGLVAMAWVIHEIVTAEIRFSVGKAAQ